MAGSKLKKRGFAALSEIERKRIASKGGKASRGKRQPSTAAKRNDLNELLKGGIFAEFKNEEVF